MLEPATHSNAPQRILPDPKSLHDVDVLALALLSALWAGALLVIGLQGDFPLNDDWAYARATQTFLETGRFERDVWTYAPIFTNVGIGAVFSWIFGFSFEALRLSNVCMGWAGMVGSYLLFRQLGAAIGLSLFGAGVVGFNPVYLNLSYTFMTDVPFAALTIWSLLLLAKGLTGPSWPVLAGGLALAVAATLSRQPGLAMAPALLLAASAAPDSLRPRLLRLGLVGLVGVLLALVLAAALGAPSLSGMAESVRAATQGRSLLRDAAEGGLAAFVDLGLFLCPVVGLTLAWRPALLGRAVAWASAVASILLLTGLALAGDRMPLGGNVLYDLGLGPTTLHGAQFVPGAPEWVWWLVTAVAVASGSFTFAAVGHEVARDRLRHRPDELLMLGFALFYLVPLLFVENFFDRYLLPTLAPLVGLLLLSCGHSEPNPKRRFVLGLGLLVLLAGFAVAGTRDYLEQNRARWSLLQPLIDANVPVGVVNAGFEFDGWFGLHPAREWQERRDGKSDEYLVSYLTPTNLPSLRPLDSRWYRRWLPPRMEGIVLYKRDALGSAAGRGKGRSD